MLLTPHTIIGIAIGASVPQMEIAVPVSFGMHFLADLVPHWDFFSDADTAEQKTTGWRPIAVMGDLILAVAIGMFFTLYALWVLNNPYMAVNIFLCGVAAVLPDALIAPSLYVKKSNIISDGVLKIQKNMQQQADLPWGLLSQIVIAAFSLLLILNSLTR
jgi:hypothetical protein